MRRLVGLVVVVALLAGALSIVDVLVRKSVETTIASRIEARSPGSHATVSIPSFPFLGHLAASGTVPILRADVSNVAAGPITVTQIDLLVDNLRVSRDQLVHGNVRPVSISSGQVTARISQAALDAFSHLSLDLGAGTVGYRGLTIDVDLKVEHGEVVIDLPDGLPSFKVPIPELDILPCIGVATVVPGALQLSCHFTTLPGVLKTPVHV